MTTEVLEYAYEHVWLSKAVTGDDLTAITASDAVLTGITVDEAVTPRTITVTRSGAGASSGAIPVYDIADNTEFVRPSERTGTQDLTSVSSKVRRELATMPRVEAPASFYLDNDDDGVFGLIVKDRAGTRLLRIEATDGQIWTGVVQIFDVDRTGQTGETGAAVYTATFRNFGRVKPEWEN